MSDDEIPAGFIGLFGDAASAEEMQAEQDRAAEKAAFLNFFMTLPKKEYIDFDELKSHWQALPDYELGTQELTIILGRLAAAIDNITNPSFKTACLVYIRENFALWENLATTQMDQFRHKDLALCMFSYRTLGIELSNEIIREWYLGAEPEQAMYGKNREQDNEVHKIARYPVSCAMAGFDPGNSAFNAWEKEALDHIPYFNAAQMAYTLWTYGRLAREPSPQLLEIWLEQFKAHLNKDPTFYQNRHFANIMGSAANLHVLTGKKIYKIIAGLANQHINLEQCTIGEKHQALQARLWFDFTNDPRIPARKKEETSTYESALKDFLRAANLYPRKQQGPLKKTGQKPDAIYDINGQEFIFEVDGASHFVWEVNEVSGHMQIARFNGPTLFQSALMMKFEVTAILLRVPYTMLKAIHGLARHKLQQIAQELVAGIKDQTGKAFLVRMRQKPGSDDLTLDTRLMKFSTNIEPA